MFYMDSLNMLVFIIFIVLRITVVKSESLPKKEIVIAGLFPTSHDILAGAIGRGVRPAVQLALDMVNNDTSILRDYDLRMTSNDTECDMAKATKIFFDMMDENTTKVMLFGDACSNVTGPMAQISKWWNMWQLSYADTDPKLSDRSTYSNFFRTVPSDSDFNPASIALLRYFNWTRVGTIFQDASTGSDRYGIAHHRLIELLDSAGMDVVKVESFLAEPDTAVAHLKCFYIMPLFIQKDDVRIILGFFDPEMARKVFCSARRHGMYGPKYQWIILGDYPAFWWRSTDTEECTTKELENVIEGYLSSEVLPLSSSNDITISGLTPSEYFQLYNASRGLEFSKYHGYAFDGIWVIAKAMDSILRHIDPRTLKEETFRGPTVASALNETNFMGVTGRVQFDGADRIGHVLLQQYQGGEMVKIGEYKRANDDLQLLDTTKWRGSGPPRDRNLRRWEVQRVSVAAYSVICFIAGMGIVMATIFLIFNIIFRNHGYIKMSSPYMNNVIIVGCILCYVSVFLLGTDSGVVPTHVLQYVCVAQSWVLSIGFSLAFGAMFSKTWRVHAIFTNIKLNKKIIKDYKLFIMVCVLVLIDAGILSTWQVMDHLYMTTKDLPALVVGEYEVIPIIEYCTSNSMKIWLGCLYAYKGLLLVFGCFLAWETKNVTISALNDSKYIGMSVYNVVIMCVCGAAISFTIKDQPTPAFVIISLFIVFCTTITLCLVFVPKMIELHRDPADEGRRIRATLRRKKAKQENGTAYQKRIKDVIEENDKYKEIIKQKSSEIKSLLDQLGEDSSTYDVEFKPHIHRKVMELRSSDMSSASSATEVDNISSYSDVSAFTHTTFSDSPQIRQRHLLISTRSMGSNSDNECMELMETKPINCYRSTPHTSQGPEDHNECLHGMYKGHTEKEKRDISSPDQYGYTRTLTKTGLQMNDIGIQAGEGQLCRRTRFKPPLSCKESEGNSKYDTVASISESRPADTSPSRRLNVLIQCSPMTVNAIVHEEDMSPSLAWHREVVVSDKDIYGAQEPLLQGCRQAAARSYCSSKKQHKLEKRLDDIKE